MFLLRELDHLAPDDILLTNIVPEATTPAGLVPTVLSDAETKPLSISVNKTEN